MDTRREPTTLASECAKCQLETSEWRRTPDSGADTCIRLPVSPDGRLQRGRYQLALSDDALVVVVVVAAAAVAVVVVAAANLSVFVVLGMADALDGSGRRCRRKYLRLVAAAARARAVSLVALSPLTAVAGRTLCQRDARESACAVSCVGPEEWRAPGTPHICCCGCWAAGRMSAVPP